MGFICHPPSKWICSRGSDGTPVNPSAKKRISSCTAKCFYYSISANLVPGDYTVPADSVTVSIAFKNS